MEELFGLSVRLEGNYTVVEFPYSKEYVGAVKSIGGGWFNPADKLWRFSSSRYEEVKDKLSSYLDDEDFFLGDYEIDPQLPLIADNGIKPYDHQQVMFQFAINRNSFAFFAEQGTGKSRVILSVCKYRIDKGLVKKILIFAPKGAVYATWPHQIKMWLEEKYHNFSIVSGTAKQKKEAFSKDCLFYILNYESAKYVPQDMKVDFVIIDESDRVKNHKKRTVGKDVSIAQRIRNIDCQYRAIMTGTPDTKDYRDIFGQFLFLDPSIFGNSYFLFTKRYCVMNRTTLSDGRSFESLVGFKNISELRDKIFQVGIRFTKAKCLDLPEQIYVSHFIPLFGEQKQKYLESCKLHKKQPIPNISNTLMQITDGIDLNDKAKDEVMMDIIQTSLNAGEKVTIAAHFRATTDRLATMLKCKAIHGGISAKDRDLIIREFHEKEDCNILVLQIDSGVSIDLTCSNSVIIYGANFNMGSWSQFLSRFHRSGQKKNVVYNKLIATVDDKPTIDQVVYDVLDRKIVLSDKLIDKEVSRYFEERSHDF